MNIKKLSFVTAAVITLAATTVVSVTPASAWWCRWGRCGYGWGGYGYGWGPGAVAAGVLAGAAVGAAVGAAATGPYYGPGYAPGYAPGRCPVGYHFYGGYCYPN
jgi:hypothetical protein